MSAGQTIRLIGPVQRAYANRLIDRAPDGWFMRIGEPTRTLEQNAKLHPMIDDIRRQVPDMAVFNTDDARLRFLDALGAELRFLPKLEGQGMFPVGLKSSTLSKTQFSGLLEIVYEYGARHDVVWSNPHEN